MSKKNEFLEKLAASFPAFAIGSGIIFTLPVFIISLGLGIGITRFAQDHVHSF